MSIRKRTWTTKAGVERSAWVSDFFDNNGKRVQKMHRTRAEADAYLSKSKVAIGEGTFIAERDTVTVEQAAELWLARCDRGRLERGTVQQYSQHVRLHILPFLAKVKLSRLSAATVRHFMDQLHEGKRSPQMIRGVVGSLGAIVGEAVERGLAVHNPVKNLRRQRRDNRGTRHKEKVQAGVHFPTPAEMVLIFDNATSQRWRVLLKVAALCGLRLSEIRGLRWDDVDLKGAELTVRQRADKFKDMGSPKSANARRSVPIPPGLVEELRQWKAACPSSGRLGLVFPSERGNILDAGNVRDRAFIAAVIKAGLVNPVLDANGSVKLDRKGRPITEPRYTKVHGLRHWFASWCISRKVDGGQELPLKMVSELLGHSSISLTGDVYGHLFPRSDDRSDLAAAEAALMAAGKTAAAGSDRASHSVVKLRPGPVA